VRRSDLDARGDEVGGDAGFDDVGYPAPGLAGGFVNDLLEGGPCHGASANACEQVGGPCEEGVRGRGAGERRARHDMAAAESGFNQQAAAGFSQGADLVPAGVVVEALAFHPEPRRVQGQGIGPVDRAVGGWHAGVLARPPGADQSAAQHRPGHHVPADDVGTQLVAGEQLDQQDNEGGQRHAGQHPPPALVTTPVAGAPGRAVEGFANSLDVGLSELAGDFRRGRFLSANLPVGAEPGFPGGVLVGVDQHHVVALPGQRLHRAAEIGIHGFDGPHAQLAGGIARFQVVVVVLVTASLAHAPFHPGEPLPFIIQLAVDDVPFIETYLAQELGFGWDEVHEIAEELEHVSSEKLIQKLFQKLGNPLYDPHGDPIPDERGKFHKIEFIKLSEAKTGRKYHLSGVADHTGTFLKFLDKNKLKISDQITVLEIESFDGSMLIECNGKEIRLSLQMVLNLLVK
jgi:hypothetical protein